MKEISFGNKVEYLPLEYLVINLGQVRTDHVGKDIQELAESIKKVGLLEPIVVCPAEEKGKYEIIAGQRRYLAHKELNAKTIKAVIINEKLEDHEAKVLSLTENMHRLGLSRKDEINACLVLWRRYKNVGMIVQETGLPPHKIRKNLKYQILPKPLKKMVDEETVDLDSAVRATEAASVSGEIDEEDAVTLAKEMCIMSGPQKKKIVESRKDSPDKPIDEIVEAAKTGEKITQVVITLGHKVHQGLKKYAAAESASQDTAGANLIEESLIAKGFIEEE